MIDEEFETSRMLVTIRPSDRLVQLCKRRKEEAETIDKRAESRNRVGFLIGVKLSYHSRILFHGEKSADIIARAAHSCRPVAILCSIRNENRWVIGSRTAALALLSGNNNSAKISDSVLEETLNSAKSQI